MTEQLQTLGTPVTDPTEASLMKQEYSLLLNKLLNACDGTQPAVAIASAISAAFCVAVDATEPAHSESARKYLQGCIADAFNSMDIAFAAKAGAQNDDVADTGVVGGTD